jgi:hypothetical protein
MKAQELTRHTELLARRVNSAIQHRGAGIFSLNLLAQMAEMGSRYLLRDYKKILVGACERLERWHVTTVKMNTLASQLTLEQAMTLEVNEAMEYVKMGANYGHRLWLFACNGTNPNKNGALAIADLRQRKSLVVGTIERVNGKFVKKSSGQIGAILQKEERAIENNVIRGVRRIEQARQITLELKESVDQSVERIAAKTGWRIKI